VRRLLVGLSSVLLLWVAPVAPAGAADPAPDVLEKRVLGESVRGRPLTAWHLGHVGPDRDPGRRTPTVVLVSTMHGDEPATRRILESLRDGGAVRGVDLWVLPVVNPDGLASGRRRNAHGVDLNRNFPHDWVDLDGSHESGPRPGSEPETQAVMRFLRQVDPDFVLSFHQPLHGVDVAVERPAFARHVARTLRLPTTSLDCGGLCHGTMTQWFNDRFDGFALTVEYGARPPERLMRETAPRQVLRVFGATAGR